MERLRFTRFLTLVGVTSALLAFAAPAEAQEVNEAACRVTQLEQTSGPVTENTERLIVDYEIECDDASDNAAVHVYAISIISPCDRDADGEPYDRSEHGSGTILVPLDETFLPNDFDEDGVLRGQLELPVETDFVYVSTEADPEAESDNDDFTDPSTYDTVLLTVEPTEFPDECSLDKSRKIVNFLFLLFEQHHWANLLEYRHPYELALSE